MCRAWSLVVVIFMAAWASAQAPAAGNVFFGYSYENADSTAIGLTTNRPNMQGWDAQLEGKIFPHIGIVTDLGGNYGSQSAVDLPNGGSGSATGHEFKVLFGPRVAIPIGKFTPFGEFMVGVAHINVNVSETVPVGDPSNTSFANAVGGGVDYRIIRPVAWRFEGDYIQTRFFSATQNDIRISTGIVIRF